MNPQEKFRGYQPDLLTEVEDLSSEELLKQYLYLESGIADEKDPRKGVSLGLSLSLKNRRDALRARIVTCLEAYVVESA